MLAGCTALSQPGIHLSLAQQYDQWWAVKVRGTSEWRFVPNPKQQGIKTASAYAEGLYYRHADATMLILCMRKQGTLAETAQYHVTVIRRPFDLASTSFSSGRSHHTRCDHDHTNHVTTDTECLSSPLYTPLQVVLVIHRPGEEFPHDRRKLSRSTDLEPPFEVAATARDTASGHA
jgi:hypothetical protein